MTALTAEERQARRESLLVLLSRAQRGVLTTSEAGLLRAHVETELDAADRAHDAECHAEQAERGRAEEEGTVLRHMNYLADTQRECGAPNWPDLAGTVRALRERAEQAEATVRRIRETARRHGPTLTADEIEHALATPEQRP